MDYSKAADSVAETIAKCGKPLTDDQKMVMAGATEVIGIKRCVLLGDEDLAKHMVKNVFDAKEFFDALRLVARLEVLRLDDKLKRFCCEKGEALRLSGTCCPDCAAISDGYAAAMTPNAKVSGAGTASAGLPG